MAARSRMFWGPLTAVGLGIGAVACVLDQASKLWLLKVFDLAGKGVVKVAPFVDLVLASPRKYQGFVAQEQFSLPEILDNRFGQYYAPGGTKDVSSAVVVKGEAGHQRRIGAAQAAASPRRKK